MLFGIISLFVACYKYAIASYTACKTVSGGLLGEEPDEQPDMDKYMLREEFDLFNCLRNVSIAMFTMSCVTCSIAKLGFYSSWRKSYWSSMGRCGGCCMSTVFLILIGFFCAYQLRKIDSIAVKYNPPAKPQPQLQPHHSGWESIKGGYGDHKPYQEMWKRQKELERQKAAAPPAPATEAPTAKEPIYLVNIEPVLEDEYGCTKVTG